MFRPTFKIAFLMIIAAVGFSRYAQSADSHSPKVDFKNDIIPVLTKLGCNAGACHGSAAGRGEFKLSLYGGDPIADFQAIVQDLEGRRIDLHRPAQSLLLLKPTESLAHGGGYLIEQGSESEKLLLSWISHGATDDSHARLERLDVSPMRVERAAIGERIHVQTVARYSDGSTRDVSRWTVLTTEDAAAVQVDTATGELEVRRRGRHIAVARYLDQVVPIEVLVPLNETAPVLSEEISHNFIDDELLRSLNTLGLPVSPQCDDREFIRRATLSLTGRLPVVISHVSAYDRSQPLDRAVLIDNLLASEEFVEYWTWQLAKLLRVGAKADPAAAQVYHGWLSSQVRNGIGYDQISQQLLLSLGDSHVVGPANFYRTVAGPRQQAEFMSELFLGCRLRCANCHNHPLDRWTQDDYHGLAAIFAKVKAEQVVEIQSHGEVIHPRTLEPARPRLPGENFLDESPKQAADSELESLAEWLIDRRNPYFAKAFVNRLWKQMMGRGLVEPVDDHRATNPATHPQLLEKLADEFIAHEYDLRHILRLIAQSAAYSRGSTPLPENRDDDRFYSRYFRTPLEAEVLADAIADVIGIAEPYGDNPQGTRAIAVISPMTSSESLDILGRCSRKESCESSATSPRGLTQKLHLLNGGLLNARIDANGSRLQRLQTAQIAPLKIIEQFYEAALNRLPSADESDFWKAELEQLELRERSELLSDMVWAMLTCEEFITN